MKIDRHISDELTKLEIEVLQQKQKEYRFLGSMNKKKGHTIFSFNLKTGEIKPAEIEYKNSPVSIISGKELPGKKKIRVEPDCIYIQALNRKNVIKRIKRLWEK